MSKRNYAAGITEGLVLLSQGRCYWPDCYNRVVEFVKGRPAFIAERAHIRAKESGGPRYDLTYPDELVDSFDNLIILCTKHHREVDKFNPEKYSVSLLEVWKENREGNGVKVLNGLKGLTEERLQELMTDAIETACDRVDEAVERFEQFDSQAAALIRGIIDEFDGFRLRAIGFQPDAIGMAYAASRDLQHLQDNAPLLMDAAEKLKNLPDAANTLMQAAQEVKTMRSFM